MCLRIQKRREPPSEFQRIIAVAITKKNKKGSSLLLWIISPRRPPPFSLWFRCNYNFTSASSHIIHRGGAFDSKVWCDLVPLPPIVDELGIVGREDGCAEEGWEQGGILRGHELGDFHVHQCLAQIRQRVRIRLHRSLSVPIVCDVVVQRHTVVYHC